MAGAGPQAPFMPVIAAASAAESGALSIEHLRVIRDVADAARVVRERGDQAAVGDDAGPFMIDRSRLEMLPGEYRPMVAAAVARANCDPSVTLERAESVRGASAADIGKLLEEIGKGLPAANRLSSEIRAIFQGSTAKAHWWGAAVDLTPDAARALASAVGVDLNSVLAALVPFIPKLAPVLAVTLPAGLALRGWINAVLTDKGVRLELLFWVVPWVEGR